MKKREEAEMHAVLEILKEMLNELRETRKNTELIVKVITEPVPIYVPFSEEEKKRIRSSHKE